MKRIRLIVEQGLLALAAGAVLLVGCHSANGVRPTQAVTVGPSDTLAVTSPAVGTTSSPIDNATPYASATVTVMPPATATALPTSTPNISPTNRPSQTPIPSPTADFTATVESLAAADPVNRTCPNPPPAKPDYHHFYLSGEQWPFPKSEIEQHFWLAKPMPGGGRFLYTEWLPYGYDAGGRYLLHNGIDAAEPQGTPVLAVDDGIVVVAGDDFSRLYGWRCDWYGHLVVIELDRRWREQPVYAVYGHVLNMTVRPGERVSRGQQVAEVGYGGAAQLPHLHFEVRVGANEFGATRNPLLWLEPPVTRGLIVGRLVDPEGRPWQGVTIAAVGRSEGTETHTTWTYLGDPQNLINPDETMAENFVLADLRPGDYELYVKLQDEVYTEPVTVKAGEMILVEIATQAFKTPTPGAPPVASPEVTQTPTAPV